MTFRGALKIAVHLASSKNLGYPAINSALWKLDSKSSSTLYTKLVESLQSNDIHIQLTTVKFFNAMLSSAPDGEKQALVSQLERVSLSKQLKVSNRSVKICLKLVATTRNCRQ
jgi:hypothetical protein